MKEKLDKQKVNYWVKSSNMDERCITIWYPNKAFDMAFFSTVLVENDFFVNSAKASK